MATAETALALYTGNSLPIFREYNQSLMKIETQTKKVAQADENSKKKVEDLRKVYEGCEKQVESYKKKIQDLEKQLLKKTVETADQLTTARNRLSVIVDDGGSVQELQDKLYGVAQRSGTSYMDTMQQASKLGLQAGGAFSSNDEMLQFMELMNKGFSIAGVSEGDQSAVMDQLGKAMGSGGLQAGGVQTLIEKAPVLAQSIEDYMYKVQGAQGSLEEWAAQGQLTAEVLKNAMFTSAGDINTQFSQIPLTFAQMGQNLQNVAIKAFEPLLLQISEFANSAGGQAILDGLANGLYAISNLAQGVFSAVGAIAGFIQSNWSFIGPIVWGIVGAMLAYNAAMVLGNIMLAAKANSERAAAASAAMHSGASLAQAAATTTASGAQVGLNSALMACPIMWIVMLVILLIALFYGVVAAINHFTGSTISATGVIFGSFMAILAGVGNIIGAIWNFIIDIVTVLINLFVDFANFFANVFKDPIGSVCRLFFGFADKVLGVVEAIASAIDMVFGSNLAASVQGWRGNLTDWVDDTFGKGDEIVAKLDLSAYRMDHLDYANFYDKGYNAGKGLEDNLSDLFDSSKLMTDLPADSLSASALQMDELCNQTGATANHTGAMAESMELADEDLQYLRDLAERDAINQFTTAEIRLDMGGLTFNSQNMDDNIDGIVSKLEEKLYESMTVAAEGVYY